MGSGPFVKGEVFLTHVEGDPKTCLRKGLRLWKGSVWRVLTSCFRWLLMDPVTMDSARPAMVVVLLGLLPYAWQGWQTVRDPFG